VKSGDGLVNNVQKRVIAVTGLFPVAGARSNAKAKLNQFCIVTLTGNQQQVGNPPATWTEIQYTDPHNGTTFAGWVYDGYLEDYPNAGTVVPIDSSVRLPYASLAVQDIIYDKIKQYNLCGEFSVAHIVGDGIVNLLNKWASNAPATASVILPKGLPTGLDQIKTILAVYGLKGPFLGFLEGLKDPLIGKRPYLATSGRMAKMLQSNWLLAGVRIDNRTGVFVRSGGPNHVDHWIVVEAVTPFGLNNGYVQVYNPFPNDYQTITFRLLLESMGSGDPALVDDSSGLWIPKPSPAPGSVTATST
jgi:hypothetical protein